MFYVIKFTLKLETKKTAAKRANIDQKIIPTSQNTKE